MIKRLVYNSDIKIIQNKPSLTPLELELIQQSTLIESKIQQSCKRIFDHWIVDNNLKGLFVQLDNGGKSGGRERVKKKLMGTIAGMPDCMLLITNKKGKTLEIFVEFKRISNPAAIEPKDSQIKIQEKLVDMGRKVYLTNNTVYFREAILRAALLLLSNSSNYDK